MSLVDARRLAEIEAVLQRPFSVITPEAAQDLCETVRALNVELANKAFGDIWQAIGYLESALIDTLMRTHVTNVARGHADLIGTMAQLSLCLEEIVEEAQDEAQTP